MKKGKLIVIEGLDGSGKATQSKILCSELRNKLNKKVCKISFPDYNEPSSALVKMYLNSEFGESPEDVNAYAASSFYATDRYASYVKFWEKRYESGQIIIADRYTTSNMIYQMNKLPKENWEGYINWVEDYEYNKLALPRPDIVIYFDMPIKISQEFMLKRYGGKTNCKDLHEKNVSFLEKCRKSALFAAQQQKWNVIACSDGFKPKTIDEIRDTVFNLVKDVV